MSKPTDHRKQIEALRTWSNLTTFRSQQLSLLVAADLLEMHDRASLSLDNWRSARRLVELYTGEPVQRNNA